jgi:hypothetical protein
VEVHPVGPPPTHENLLAELAEAKARLRAHMATWEYAFAMASGCHGGRNHPAHVETHARTERLAARCRELHTRLAEHQL